MMMPFTDHQDLMSRVEQDAAKVILMPDLR